MHFSSFLARDLDINVNEKLQICDEKANNNKHMALRLQICNQVYVKTYSYFNRAELSYNTEIVSCLSVKN